MMTSQQQNHITPVRLLSFIHFIDLSTPFCLVLEFAATAYVICFSAGMDHFFLQRFSNVTHAKSHKQY